MCAVPEFRLPAQGVCSRRRWLQIAGAAGASAAAMRLAADEAPTVDTRAPIDAHVHVWTPDTERYPLAAGFRRDEMKPPSFTPEQLFEHARPCGVGRVVLIQMSFYGFDNSYMLDTIRRFPGVYAGVAVIDDSSPDPPDQMRGLARQGVRGFRIYPRNLPVDRWLNGEGMQSMWKCGAAEGLAMCHLVNPDALAAIDANCQRFPDTPVVIDHFARIGVDGAIRAREIDALCRLARHRKTYVKLSAFYALGAKKAPYDDLIPMIRRLLDAFTPQRLMWATDCPYQVQEGHTYADSIGLIRDRLDGLSDGDRDWLLRRTAEKVFFA
ncbi:MAG TPA: amidohydrolase family protein [Pirellulales bacterium]|nr:amidohydrolase family protein [Pirellulales bacterium]